MGYMSVNGHTYLPDEEEDADEELAIKIFPFLFLTVDRLDHVGLVF